MYFRSYCDYTKTFRTWIDAVSRMAFSWFDCLDDYCHKFSERLDWIIFEFDVNGTILREALYHSLGQAWMELYLCWSRRTFRRRCHHLLELKHNLRFGCDNGSSMDEATKCENAAFASSKCDPAQVSLWFSWRLVQLLDWLENRTEANWWHCLSRIVL